MPFQPSPGRYRWRRVIAASGVLTSFVALATIGHDGQPGLVSLWLLCDGLALAGLSLHAMRKERRAGPGRLPRREEGCPGPAGDAAVVDGRDPRRARRGAARPPGAADHGRGERGDPPVRAAAADARPARRADLA